MFHSSRQLLSSVVLLVVLAVTDAFFTPTTRDCSAAITPPSKVSHIHHRGVLPIISSLQQSSSDDDDGSSTINIAMISTSMTDPNDHVELQNALKDHPFCKMTGIKLSITEVSVSKEDSASWSKDETSNLQQADIACFGTIASVTNYLNNLDNHLKVPSDISDDDRRNLPNKLDLVSEIVGMESTATTTSELMAACPNVNTARECLNSGRWISNHIYYPKDTQQAVELKTEPIAGEDGNSSGEEIQEEEIDVNVWADSVVQAAGDVMERKFWGGGW